jgi:L-lactate dehydrogenase (cytochrome)
MFFDYIDGGSYDEVTLAANRDDFLSLKLRQRVMRDVSQIDTTATITGEALTMPVILAPIGLAGMFARRGEVQAVRAAEAAGIPFCLSTVGICSLEEIRAAATKPFWFQLYMMRDRGYVSELLQRAKAAGCNTLVFTVDLAMTASRYRDTRNGMLGNVALNGKVALLANLLSHPRWLRDVAIGGKPLVFGNLASYVPNARNPADFRAWVSEQFDPSVTWKDIEWLRKQWQGTLIIKGIMDAGDARAAVDVGAQGIVVSNHGGRQLDGAPSTLAMLPEIAAAVGHRTDILLDGGIRNGQDVIKAIASGARAVMIGRPWAWALAAGGESAVAAMLTNLHAEIKVTLALTGQTSAREVTRDIVLTDQRQALCHQPLDR